jgi:hypothetical protein
MTRRKARYWRWLAYFALFVLVVWLWARGNRAAGAAIGATTGDGGGPVDLSGLAQQANFSFRKLDMLGLELKKIVADKSSQMSFGMCGCNG